MIVTGDLNVAHRDIDIYNYFAPHIKKTPGCTKVRVRGGGGEEVVIGVNQSGTEEVDGVSERMRRGRGDELYVCVRKRCTHRPLTPHLAL